MKKTRYTIEFLSLETELSKEIEISKKEYIKNIKWLENKVKETEKNNHEYKIEELTKSVCEYKEFITTIRYFINCTATTILRIYICKNGYRFKNKKEIG